MLDSLGIRFWLSAGTALGLYRDGDFIPHDTDLDIGTLEITGRFDEMDRAFDEAGFSRLEATHPSLTDKFQRAYLFLGVLFDIYSYTREGDTIVAYTDSGKLVKPYGLFEDLNGVRFRGRAYPLPDPIEDYLEMRYGPDWRTPKTQKDAWTVDAASCIQA